MTSLRARLIKAKARLLGTATKDIVVPFTLRCDCGNQVSGIRRVSYQVATCSSCESGIYVLPVNVYPATKRVRSEVLDGSVASRLSVIVRDLALGEQELTPEERPNSKPVTKSGDRRSATRAASEATLSEPDSSDIIDGSKGRSRRSLKARKITAAAASLVAEQILIEEPVVRVPRPGVAVVLRRSLTPFRLLMLSAVMLIAVTGWWIVTQRRLADARKIWRHEMDVAEKALEAKDLVLLHDSLSKAVAAATTLNRDDADSRRAVSLLLQTRAVQDLSSADLVSMLAGCVSDDGKLRTEKAAVAAESLKGSWFVFECSLQQSDVGLKADLPLFVDSVPVTISISSDLLQRAVVALPQSPLMFVARVEGCVVDGGREFQIQLNGETSTLITTQYHAGQIGFIPANVPGLNALLVRQSEFLRSDKASTGKDRE